MLIRLRKISKNFTHLLVKLPNIVNFTAPIPCKGLGDKTDFNECHCKI